MFQSEDTEDRVGVMTIIGSRRRHPYFPIFEALLGPGLIHECVVWKDDREEFQIGWQSTRAIDKSVRLCTPTIHLLQTWLLCKRCLEGQRLASRALMLNNKLSQLSQGKSTRSLARLTLANFHN